MSTITASLVKELRQRTGAGMMECKKALVESNADLEKAIEIMRKSGQAKAVKKAGREAAEGLVVITKSSDGNTSLIMEINCETDFVAREKDFQTFANNVANLILEKKVASVEELKNTQLGVNTVEEARTELVAKIGENISIRRFSMIEAKSGQYLGTYLHGGAELARIGVVVLLEKEDEELAKDLAMHIAAMNPECVSKEEISADRIAKEKEVFLAQEKDSKKPPEIMEKIIAGKINKFCSEISLLGQTFVKDNNMSVEALLKQKQNKVLSFTKFAVGEGIERAKTDFVADVMSQVNN